MDLPPLVPGTAASVPCAAASAPAAFPQPARRASATNYQRGDLPYAGADIYRIPRSAWNETQILSEAWTPERFYRVASLP